jgi:predicted ATP-dependent endonuclease of OLD family
MINKLSINKFGMLTDAKFTFKDLNVFVGPQATGKSLTLQLIKLIEDKAYVNQQLEQYNYDWKSNKEKFSGIDKFAEIYFGEGMHGALNNADVKVAEKKFDFSSELKYRKGYGKGQEVKCFYIPAQRVLMIEDGWPKAFESFDNTYPYVLREYSDLLRNLLNKTSNETIFPQTNRLKKCLRNQIADTIFHDADIRLNTNKSKKRMLLNIKGTSQELPMTLISAGQREFLPYLISLYYLMPAGKIKNINHINTVIIEEPEMGLHPLAIRTFLLSVIELIARGYRVFISTHSVDLLNYIWVLIEIQKIKKPEKQKEALLKLIGVKLADVGDELLTSVIKKKTTVHYFKLKDGKVNSVDISKMDFESDIDTKEWGGLLHSATLSSEIISSL